MKFAPRTLVLIVVLTLIGGSILYFESQKTSRDGGGAEVVATRMSREEKVGRYAPAKEITSPDGFINTKSVTVQEFIGKKVVLVDFWTYSCINCQRTTPYLNAWYEKYKDQGLEIIGIHTPEFEFEKEYENVTQAVSNFKIKYPVVLDNDYSTWTAYENRYWPRKYLIDIDGFIVYDHIGEGGYEETERKIQEALAERMSVLGLGGEIVGGVANPEGVDIPDFTRNLSPEIYFGAARNERLGNGRVATTGTQSLLAPQNVKSNTLYMTGDWDFNDEFAKNISGNAKIIFRYQGKTVHFVSSASHEIKVRVLIDGKPILRERAGEDVVDGAITVREPRRYGIVRDKEYGEHTLELIIESPGLEAYTFTFG